MPGVRRTTGSAVVLLTSSCLLWSCAAPPESSPAAAQPANQMNSTAASTPETAPAPARRERTEIVRSAEDGPDDAMLAGPAVPASPGEDDQDLSTSDAEQVAEAAPAKARQAPEVEPAPGEVGAPADGVARTDGRPVWWLEAPRHDAGSVMVSAEALASDVLGARRAAVEAGRAALERAVGRPVHDERVESTFVKPIPVTSNSPRAARFIAYVLMSAPLESE